VGPRPAPLPVASPAPVTPSELIELTPEESTDSTQVLRVTGDLDTCTANELRAPLPAHIVRQGDRRPVDLDLTAPGYLSSSGIALLLEAAYLAQRTGRAFGVTSLSGSAPDRILTLAGLGDALAVCRTSS
jgi:anti-anti-sigma factor